MRHDVGAPSQGRGRVERGEVLVVGGGLGPWGQSCGNELLVSEEDELYYRNTELLFWGLIWGTVAGSPSHAAQHRYTLVLWQPAECKKEVNIESYGFRLENQI